jgi:hypothetical protein
MPVSRLTGKQRHIPLFNLNTINMEQNLKNIKINLKNIKNNIKI